MKVKVTVFMCASKEIEVELPENARDRDVRRAMLMLSLERDLPEVFQGSCFEYPTGFQMEGDTFVVDMKG